MTTERKTRAGKAVTLLAQLRADVRVWAAVMPRDVAYDFARCKAWEDRRDAAAARLRSQGLIP